MVALAVRESAAARESAAVREPAAVAGDLELGRAQAQARDLGQVQDLDLEPGKEPAQEKELE